MHQLSKKALQAKAEREGKIIELLLVYGLHKKGRSWNKTGKSCMLRQLLGNEIQR